MKYRFITYGFWFIATTFGVMGIIILMLLLVSDREAFSSLLSDLGSFGGFLSGVGTIIAAAVAAYGVDTWSRQLKVGKYLAHIWNFKALLSKFENEFNFWHAFYKSTNERLKLKSSDSFDAINDALNELSEVSLHLDVLSSESEEKWVRNIRGLQMLVKDHKRFLDTTDFNADDLGLNVEQAKKVIERFEQKKSYVDRLRFELDNLESSS